VEDLNVPTANYNKVNRTDGNGNLYTVETHFNKWPHIVVNGNTLSASVSGGDTTFGTVEEFLTQLKVKGHYKATSVPHNSNLKHIWPPQ
jgi:hypothetical protein